MVHLSGSVRVSFAAIYQRRCLQLKKQKFKKQSKEAEILKQREKVQKQRERIKFSEFLRGKGKKSLSFSISIVPNFKDVDNIGAAITNFSGILKNLLKFRRDVPGNFTKICFQKWTI